MLVFALIALFLNLYSEQSAVTYSGGGRFGDKIFVYSKAKWISYTHKIPLFYVPFEHSSGLIMHQEEKRYSAYIAAIYTPLIVISRRFRLPIDPDNGALYHVPFYAPIRPDYTDLAFKRELRRMICPLKPLALVEVPKNIISVAVHVRKGGGADPSLLSEQLAQDQAKGQKIYADVRWPLKFPPDAYYIEQIKHIAQIFSGHKLYIYIFTDDRNPAAIVAKYKRAIGRKNLIFDYRRTVNAHDKNVLEDFFSMIRFDCLIRSASLFSCMAAKLADYKVEIAPKHGYWKDGTLIIDQVDVQINDPALVVP